ncbi:MAG TPA: hypothetical protein VK213_00385 [Bacteroidales bacterium]|nr:hypothetical protein [Bacteroidales bacterium]
MKNTILSMLFAFAIIAGSCSSTRDVDVREREVRDDGTVVKKERRVDDNGVVIKKKKRDRDIFNKDKDDRDTEVKVKRDRNRDRDNDDDDDAGIVIKRDN